MKNSIPLFFASFALAFMPVSARINDTKSSLDSRITSGRGAIIVDEQANGLISQSSLAEVVRILGAKEIPIEVRSYYKVADGRRTSTNTLRNGEFEDGWYYSAVFLQGVVVAECYRRIGGNRSRAINNAERDGLLSINRGGQPWVALNNMRTPGGEQLAGFTHFDYMTADGAILAQMTDRGRPLMSGAIFVRRELNELVLKAQAEQQEEQNQKALETVSTSLSGF